MSHPCGVGAPRLSQVNVSGLCVVWSLFWAPLSWCTGKPLPPGCIYSEDKGFSRLRGNLSCCVWVKAIATVNGLSQQQCLQTSFLFLCSSGEPVANPWAHRETPLRACLYLTRRLQLSFIFCGLFKTVWGPVSHWYMRTAEQHDCLLFSPNLVEDFTPHCLEIIQHLQFITEEVNFNFNCPWRWT